MYPEKKLYFIHLVSYASIMFMFYWICKWHFIHYSFVYFSFKYLVSLWALFYVWKISIFIKIVNSLIHRIRIMYKKSASTSNQTWSVLFFLCLSEFLWNCYVLSQFIVYITKLNCWKSIFWCFFSILETVRVIIRTMVSKNNDKLQLW